MKCVFFEITRIYIYIQYFKNKTYKKHNEEHVYTFLNDFMVYDQNQNWHVIFFNLNFHPHLIILEIDQCN
jgi:hypothetical protein